MLFAVCSDAHANCKWVPRAESSSWRYALRNQPLCMKALNRCCRGDTLLVMLAGILHTRVRRCIVLRAHEVTKDTVILASRNTPLVADPALVLQQPDRRRCCASMSRYRATPCTGGWA